MSGVRLRPPRRRKLEVWYKPRLPGRQVFCADAVYNDATTTASLQDYEPFGISTWRWSMLENGEAWCRLLSMEYADPGAPALRPAGDPPVWLLKHLLSLEQRNSLIAGLRSPQDVLTEVIRDCWDLSETTVLELTRRDVVLTSLNGHTPPPGADVISNGSV